MSNECYLDAEAEANIFAVELLLPERFVRAELQRLGGIDIDDEKTIKILAQKFGVFPSLMAMRIGQLSNQSWAPAK